MSVIYLAYKNMVSKPLNLILSVLLLTLSVFLVTFALDLSQQIKSQLAKNIAPFDMVVGAKGSPLQLVLSSVLHVDNPTGNITFKDVKNIKNHRFVKAAIPVSYGDNYKGFRILGTVPQYLNHYNAQLALGQVFKQSFEAVAGSNVAKQLQLNIGDSFVSSHGLIESDIDIHDNHPYKLTGILKPTGSVIDNMFITNLESVWDAHNHEHNNQQHNDETYSHHVAHDHESHSHEHKDHKHDHHEAHHHEHFRGSHNHEHSKHPFKEVNIEYDEDKEITSLLVTFKNPMGIVQLPRFINKNTNVQAALPSFEVQRLTNLFGSGVKTINGIALAILLVSGLSIFISLLKTIRERKHELALLRTYGLSTAQLLKLVLIEGVIIALISFIIGWFLGRFGIWLASQYTQSVYGYALTLNAVTVNELAILGIIFVIAIVASLLASLSIFKLNVAKTLSDV